MISWSCSKAEAVIGMRSSKLVVLKCIFCFVHLLKPWEMLLKDFVLIVYLLVRPVCNFTKRWTPCQIICQVYDHKSRQLFCRTNFSGCFWLLKTTNLLSKQNISFSPHMEIKKAIRQRMTLVAQLTCAERWMEIHLKTILLK